MKIALAFPGQGSQALGMGRDFFDNFPIARHVFEEVDETLSPLYGHTLSNVIFDGPEDKLAQTHYTQASLMTVSMAILRVLENQLGAPLSSSASFMAGHSLGEYSALCASHVLNLSDTATLLYYRGTSMQEAVPLGKGAMAAILGLDVEGVESILSDIDGVCLANDNGNQQNVISGTKEAVEKAMSISLEKGAKRAIPLNVSAPFHSPLMELAAQKMKEKIDQTTFHDAVTPVITNIDALACQSAEQFKEKLVAQICGRVRWRETIEYFVKEDVTHFIEIGSGKVLSNITKRMAPQIQSFNVSTVGDVDKILTLFG